ncbi:MAG: type II toxin-antitoxin system PemK/MazF family toxin [Pirellulales bacterium]
MARFVKGDVVVVPFPFTDLSQTKRRPALVVAVLPGDDCILCQITSRAVRDSDAIALNAGDFRQGALHKPSSIRPNRLFTADTGVIVRRVGKIKTQKLDSVTKQIIAIFTR